MIGVESCNRKKICFRNTMTVRFLTLYVNSVNFIHIFMGGSIVGIFLYGNVTQGQSYPSLLSQNEILPCSSVFSDIMLRLGFHCVVSCYQVYVLYCLSQLKLEGSDDPMLKNLAKMNLRFLTNWNFVSKPNATANF